MRQVGREVLDLWSDIQINKQAEYAISHVYTKYQGELNRRRGDRVSVHFAVTFLDWWRTSFCVTTIIKIVNNKTNDKQTSGISGVWMKIHRILTHVCLH